MKNKTGKRPGENLYMNGGTKNINPVDSVNKAVKFFYSEGKNYNFDTQSTNGGETGHFTQLIWGPSTQLGIGFAQGEKANFVVLLYREHGNVKGKYRKYVFPPKRPPPEIRDIGPLNGVGRIIKLDIMIIILWALATSRCQYYI